MKQIEGRLKRGSRHIYLQAITEKDLEKLCLWKNDFELSKLIKAHPFPTSLREVENWVRRSESDKNQVLFGIYLGENNVIIGIARLMFIDWISSNAELGIYIGEKGFRGRGFGKKATILLLDYAFKQLNLKRIYLRVLKTNLNAIKLYQSVGFREEGVLRESFWTGDGYSDVTMMGLLRNEFDR